MTDNITLPRELAYQVPLHELLESVPSDARLVIDYADGKGTRFIPVGRLCREAATILRTALAAEQPKHPGYIIGSHWLETAYSRVCAGEAEADVLRDCGWERVDDIEAMRRDADIEALRRDAERYRWLRDKAPPDIGDMASVRDSHDPSEIDAAIDAAMKEDKT